MPLAGRALLSCAAVGAGSWRAGLLLPELAHVTQVSGDATNFFAVLWNELFAHVTHVSGDAIHSFAVLKVSKDVGFDQDLYLIVCYVPPMQSNSIALARGGVWPP